MGSTRRVRNWAFDSHHVTSVRGAAGDTPHPLLSIKARRAGLRNAPRFTANIRPLHIPLSPRSPFADESNLSLNPFSIRRFPMERTNLVKLSVNQFSAWKTWDWTGGPVWMMPAAAGWHGSLKHRSFGGFSFRRA